MPELALAMYSCTYWLLFENWYTSTEPVESRPTSNSIFPSLSQSALSDGTIVVPRSALLNTSLNVPPWYLKTWKKSGEPITIS